MLLEKHGRQCLSGAFADHAHREVYFTRDAQEEESARPGALPPRPEGPDTGAVPRTPLGDCPQGRPGSVETGERDKIGGGARVSHQRDLIGPLALLVIGVILLLRNLGYLPASLDQWWPVVLIVIGLGIILRRSSPDEMVLPKEPSPAAPGSARQPGTMKGRRHSTTGGLILIGLGLAFLASNLFGGRSTGALVMIALGLALLIGRIW